MHNILSCVFITKNITGFLWNFVPFLKITLFSFFIISTCCANPQQADNEMDSLSILVTKTADSSFKKVDLLNDLAYAHYLKAEYKESIECLKTAITLSEKYSHKRGLARSSGNIANVYSEVGSISLGVEMKLRALKIHEELNDTVSIIISLTGLGNSYLDQGFFKKAIDHQNKALNLSKLTNNSEMEATVLSNIANFYSKKKEYNTELEFNKKSLTLWQKLKDERQIARVLNNIGANYFNLGIHHKALEFYIEAYSLYEKYEDKRAMAITLINFAELYLKQNDFNNALLYAKKSLALSKEIGVLHIITDAYQVLSEIYAAIGNTKEELKHYKLYVQTKDSLQNENTIKQTAIMSAIYETEKKEKEIELLNKEKEKQAAVAYEQNKKKNLIISAVIAGLLIVIVFSAFLFNRFNVTRKQKVIIEEKQKEITDSINFAKRIQTAILPPDNFWKKYLPQSFVLYKPKDIVSGDFYWLENVNDLVLFAAADCTGHGVSGAMVSVVCSNALNRTAKEFGITEPSKILDKTRELVLETFEKSDEDVKDGMDISLCCLNTKTNELLWAGANNPLWYIRANNIYEIKGDKQPIGKNDNPKQFTTHKIKLEPGDTIYIFTDGYADQFGGEKGKKFMYKRLKNLLTEIHKKPLEIQKEVLQQNFTSWKGGTEQTDDVLLIGLKII